MPRKKAQTAFTAAVLLLFVSGLVVYFTIVRLHKSEQWVVHSYEVRAMLGDIDSALAGAGRARSAYVATGAANYIDEFELAARDSAQELQYLRGLTRDNPEQQELCVRLEEVTARRIALYRESVKLQQTGPENRPGQDDLSRRAVLIATEMTVVTKQMRDEEQILLSQRTTTANHMFGVAVFVLTTTFVMALFLFSIHYRLLAGELDARDRAERMARDSEESLRRLTGRLLQLQDEERRRFSRELHDSLGQYLSGIKMNLDIMAGSYPEDELLRESIELLDQSIGETRTISHLLHPPLLDEAGFSSAAKWYLEGFAQRSGIAVRTDLPDNPGRLPEAIELGLFRILQESLTNIHRHSASIKAEVSVTLFPDKVVLKVRDYGKGISNELLKGFNRSKTGVGLAGMRERARELGGQLEILRTSPGTLVTATLPLKLGTQVIGFSAAD